jgi:hypothetical protein
MKHKWVTPPIGGQYIEGFDFDIDWREAVATTPDPDEYGLAIRDREDFQSDRSMRRRSMRRRFRR